VNDAAIDDFEQWMVHAGYRDSTIRRSVQDVTQLVDWTEQEREVPRRLKPSVKRLLMYFEKRDIIPRGALAESIAVVLEPPPQLTPMERRRARQKRKRRQQTSYPDADWKALWAGVRGDTSPEARVLEVMLATGLRVGDVLRLTRARLRDGLVRTVITIEQKGGDDRLIYIEGVEEPWARLHAAFDGTRATNVALLVSPEGDGSPLSADAAYRAVNRQLKRIGTALDLPGPHRTHRLRRTVAVQALRITEDVTAVQQLMGHKSVQTTFGYISEARPEREAELRKQLGQLFRPDD
jgi:integrase/recombinase XerC